MRSGRAWLFTVATATIALLAAAVGAAAQGYEEFPGPGDAPLEGYTRSDGTIVLTDEAFCRFLLGTIWGDEELTPAALIDRSKKQRKARAAAFTPGSDEPTLARCAEVIAAYRGEATADDGVAAWARRSPVVPEALVGLLPDDLVADPLAVAAPVLEASRTSGFGDVVSAPFEMPQETWLVQVDAAGCASWSGTLRDARDDSNVIEVSDTREYLYNVRPGHYYWDVSAPDCDWSVDLALVEIGPDPNATPLPRVPVPQLYGENWNAGQPNPGYLTASQAYQAIVDAGLTVGECTEEPFQTPEQGFIDPSRVWGQDPPPGTLLELGSPIDVFATSDCDVIRGDRVVLE